MGAPVHDVSIVGLGMRDTAYTYMDFHSLPSGGDWSLERSAVVFVEGSERVTVEGCVFDRVDGNAIIFSAYNRNASITYNEFAWIGATAIALWGNTEDSPGADRVMPEGYGSDGTSGNQPRFTTVAYNLAREIGVLEKQSSFYTQFKSAQNHVHSNIVYNGPRAHLNNNDGFGGGQLIENNLVFNSCRESGDHGPFNSWFVQCFAARAQAGLRAKRRLLKQLTTLCRSPGARAHLAAAAARLVSHGRWCCRHNLRRRLLASG